MLKTSLLICATSLGLLSACSSTGPAAPVENPVQNPGARSGTIPGSNGNGIGNNGLGVGEAPRAITPASNADGLGARGADTQVGKSIFFDYNEYVVKPEYQDMLRQNFSGRTRETTPIRLEGNADERGSAEYNLALGQKRAEAVKRQLLLLGVPETQLEAVSLGSEKPRETCHEERCWAVNRRVDIMRQGR